MFISILLIGIAAFVISYNTKEKNEYIKKTGQIEYFEHTYQDLPTRHHGEYRYLKIDSYEYVFEIYVTNSNKNSEPIDNLEVGDTIKTFFYETESTHSDQLNRYIQFVDKNDRSYFIRGNFQRNLGYVFYGLIVFLNVLAFAFWKKGKLAW